MSSATNTYDLCRTMPITGLMARSLAVAPHPTDPDAWLLLVSLSTPQPLLLHGLLHCNQPTAATWRVVTVDADPSNEDVQHALPTDVAVVWSLPLPPTSLHALHTDVAWLGVAAMGSDAAVQPVVVTYAGGDGSTPRLRATPLHGVGGVGGVAVAGGAVDALLLAGGGLHVACMVDAARARTLQGSHVEGMSMLQPWSGSWETVFCHTGCSVVEEGTPSQVLPRCVPVVRVLVVLCACLSCCARAYCVVRACRASYTSAHHAYSNEALMLIDLHLLDEDDTFSDEDAVIPQPTSHAPEPLSTTFPVTFFESTTNVSSEVILGGDLQAVGGPERAAALLGEVEGFVESATPAGMKITVRCAAPGMAVVGVKLHVGQTGRGHVPRGVVVCVGVLLLFGCCVAVVWLLLLLAWSNKQVAGRHVSINHVNRRWLSLPLTDQEAAESYPELTIKVQCALTGLVDHFLSVQPPSHVYHRAQIMGAHSQSCCPRIDALQVFAKPRSDLQGGSTRAPGAPSMGPVLPALPALVPVPHIAHKDDLPSLADCAVASMLIDAVLHRAWDGPPADTLLPTPQQLVGAPPPASMSAMLATALRLTVEDGGLRLGGCAAAARSAMHRAVAAALAHAPTDVSLHDAWAWLHVWIQVRRCVACVTMTDNVFRAPNHCVAQVHVWRAHSPPPRPPLDAALHPPLHALLHQAPRLVSSIVRGNVHVSGEALGELVGSLVTVVAESCMQVQWCVCATCTCMYDERILFPH